MQEAWKEFKGGKWENEINVSNFIKANYQPYLGNEDFLTSHTEKTKKVLKVYEDMCKEEVKKHVIDIDVDTPAGINNYKPGYICKEDDCIVGLQTDKPLKRIINPYGGIRMVYKELEAYNYKLNKNLCGILFTNELYKNYSKKQAKKHEKIKKAECDKKSI